MDVGTTALVICSIYLAITLAMGVIPGLKVSKSVTGYVAGDRAMGALVLYFVIGASVFSSFAFLGAPGWAYSRGMAAMYIIAYGTLGMVPLYFMGPRARRVGAKFGFVTQAEMLAHRFDSRALSVILAVLSVVVFVPYLVLQMKGAGLIVTTLSDGRISAATGAAVVYGVVLIYVLASGVMGVGWTNTFQGMFMMVVAWGLGLYLPYKLHGGIGPMFEKILASDAAALLEAPGVTGAGDPWSWGAYSSAVLVSAVGFSVWPHYFMKSFAAGSERTLRLTIVLYPTFQLFLVPILLIGFSAILAYPGVTPSDTILPYILTQVELPALLIGLVCAGVLAASMSSGDAILHAAACIGVCDGVAKLGRPERGWKLDDRRQRLYIRIFVVALSLVSYYFAVISNIDIVSLLLGAYGGVAQIFPLVFACFYWPRANGTGALAGLLAGIGTNTFFLLLPQLKPWPLHEGIYGLAANLLALVCVSLRTAPPSAQRVRPYLDAGST